MAKLTRTWRSTLVLLLTLSGCGGSGGGGETGATTFAKVYGDNFPVEALSVLPAGDGYRIYGSASGEFASLQLDANGNRAADAEVASSLSNFAALDGRHRLLPDGRLNVGIDINRTRNRYSLHVNRVQYNSDLSQPPSTLWQHTEAMDYGTTLWNSADADINGFPAQLLGVEMLQLETAVATTGFQGAFVLLRETAAVETRRYGITRRTRLLLFHFASNGALQTIKQVDERGVPSTSGVITDEIRVFSKWVANIKLAVGHTGAYAIAIPKLQVNSYYSYTTEYTVSVYDGADGLSWTQTLGPWQTNGTGGTYNFVSVAEMGVLSGTTNLVLYLKGERLRYLGLDTGGGILWNLDLDSLNATPVGLACKELGGCLFAGLTSNPRHLLLWDEQGSQVGDFDLTATGISNASMREKQIVAWPDGAFRLLLGRNAADPANDERFLFHLSLGVTNVTLSGQGDSLWLQAGDVRAESLTLNPYGYSANQYVNTYQRIYDSSNTLLFDADSLYTRLSGPPVSVAELADGRTLILGDDESLIFLRDGRVEQRLVAAADLIPKSIVALANANRFMLIGYNGWAVYDLSGRLIWSRYPVFPASHDTYSYDSLGSAEFADGDLLLSGYLYDYADYDKEVLLYAARVGNDGTLRWQHTWGLGDNHHPSVQPLVTNDGQTDRAILAVTNTSPAISLLRLDPANGGILLRQDLAPRGAGGEINRPVYRWWFEDRSQQSPFRLAVTPTGGLWLGYTSSALVSHETAFDTSGNPESLPYGGDNMALIRFTPDLEPDRLRVYGAGGDDRLKDLHLLNDGGLLVAGSTSSFALGWDGDDNNSGAVTDAWIMRLDASGNINEGCQSLLASFDDTAASQYLGTASGTSLTETTALSASLTLTPFALDSQLGSRPAGLTTLNQPLETARMCLGTVTPPPQPTPPASGDYTLTLTLEGGPGAGEVFSLPLPPQMQCINSAEPTTVCTYSLPAGTPVHLVGNAFGGLTLSWGGCDIANSEGCTLVMDTDRQVTATFSP
ncbi:MAG: hypothetical protein P8045_08660 [Candidatus Thiodiazotropha sp.]